MIIKQGFLAALFFLLAGLRLYSQDAEIFDTLVYLDEVTYHSKLEKEAFNEFFNEDNRSFIKLFLAKDEKVTEQQYNIRLKSFLDYAEQLRNDKNYNKSEKKKVKYYYNQIHNKYLEKYEMNTSFSNVFNNGFYNCVTGSILYGLIFDKLGIPYKIKLSPIHAYLVTYPNSESILVETTNPIKGYFIFNENFKQTYVDHLLDNKLITANEYASYSTEELFNKYYFKEEDVTLKEMVGIQYYNDAIIKFQNQKFEEAFYELEKAYLFYPSEKIAYLLYYSAAIVIDKHDFSDIKYVDFLYKIARYTNYGITQEQIIGEFGRITQNQLDYKGNYELYDDIFFKLYGNLNDEKIKNEISFIYNYEKARLFIRNERYGSAFSYIEEALKIRPDHLDLQTMFVYVLASKFESAELNQETLDSLIAYGDKFPVLNDNNTYNDLVCNICLYSAIENYEEGNLNEALDFHAKFNELIKHNEHYSNYDYNVTRLYSSAAVYYFRKGNARKAKTILLEGLKLVPDSYELKQRLKVIN